ncbi:hypothetical protein [Roseibium aggregatum]|uniref:hypothetical protein n=1 Tax=Roseibium aggregatum TaxID=187304 RepID=UPI001A8C4C35|nr:hypothetical protein [Roseibium aggregatum]MBN8181047.1 hypothetical protein [Roseibium aggregatum]
MSFFKLDKNNNPIPISDDEYVELVTQGKNRPVVVAEDQLRDVIVSTVFSHIQLNEISGQNEAPLFFVTMISCGEENEEIAWHRTWDEAVEGHNNLVSNYFGEIGSEMSNLLPD